MDRLLLSCLVVTASGAFVFVVPRWPALFDFFEFLGILVAMCYIGGRRENLMDQPAWVYRVFKPSPRTLIDDCSICGECSESLIAKCYEVPSHP